jgi:hypothetical protein
MPAHYGPRCHDRQRLLPSVPQSPNEDPKQLVRSVETRSSAVSSQHCQLLPQNQIFQEKVPPRLQEPQDRAQDQFRPEEHEDVRAGNGRSSHASKPLFQKQIRVLARTGALVKTGRGPIRDHDARQGAYFRTVAKSDVVIRGQETPHGTSPSRMNGSDGSASLKGESSCRHLRNLRHRRKPFSSTPLR